MLARHALCSQQLQALLHEVLFAQTERVICRTPVTILAVRGDGLLGDDLQGPAQAGLLAVGLLLHALVRHGLHLVDLLAAVAFRDPLVQLVDDDMHAIAPTLLLAIRPAHGSRVARGSDRIRVRAGRDDLNYPRIPVAAADRDNVGAFLRCRLARPQEHGGRPNRRQVHQVGAQPAREEDGVRVYLDRPIVPSIAAIHHDLLPALDVVACVQPCRFPGTLLAPDQCIAQVCVHLVRLDQDLAAALALQVCRARAEPRHLIAVDDLLVAIIDAYSLLQIQPHQGDLGVVLAVGASHREAEQRDVPSRRRCGRRACSRL
mmetsp:Transcript_96491/g.245259  ORF Transcript_96491/g.245259 Transcript_96491/m.245259 type:complete len:317 (+) Transcript_96491:345-1295(+)